MNWQELAVFGIVGVTVGLFAWRCFARGKQSGACGGGCGCKDSALKPRSRMRQSASAPEPIVEGSAK